MKALLPMMIALMAGTPALAADMGDMKMDAQSSMRAEGKHQAAQGTGIVKSVDPDKGTITLAHEAIPALNWPAMTMRFKIDRQLAATVKPGQHVTFELMADGMGGTVTKVTALK